MDRTGIRNSVIVTAASIAGFLVFCGCTGSEVKETGRNLIDAGFDAVRDVAADPTKIATPAGLVAIGGVAAIGFFSRQAASLTKWAGSKTAGPLVRFIGGFFKSK